MKRISIVLFCTVLLLGAAWSAALAGPGAEGQQSATLAEASGGCDECMATKGDFEPSAMAKAKEGMGEPFALQPCPMCQAVGGLCEHCQAYAKDYLTNLAGSVCPNCEAPDICADCQQAVELAMAELPMLEAVKVSAPAHSVAGVTGKFFDDQGQLIMQAVAAAGQQGLLGEHSMVATLYPTVMSEPIGPDTPAIACVSLPEGASVAAPLEKFDVPGGEYMQVTHHGSYMTIGVTWMAALCFAEMNGIALGSGMAGEHYPNDPETTPEDQLITQIFLPLDPAASAETAAAPTSAS
jgi:effector-binding domain-containing protein